MINKKIICTFLALFLFGCDDNKNNVHEGNSIKISYISSTEAIEGDNATFTIDFDYSLEEPEAIINVGFTSGDNGKYTIIKDALEVVEIVNGSGSSSVTVSHVPVILEDVVTYYLYINMSPKNPSGTYSPFAGDRRLITIHPN